MFERAKYIDAELSWVAKMNDRIRHAFEMSWLGRYWVRKEAKGAV